MVIAYSLYIFATIDLILLAAADKRCFECTDAPHPADCKLVTFCSDSEDCVVQQYITTGGLILFKSGCESKARCQNLGKRSIGSDVILRSRRQESSDIVVCEECCEDEFCNLEGCGITVSKQPDRGPLCFHCSDTDDPSICRLTTECEKGQVCALYTEANGVLYKSTCLGEHVCKALAQTHTSRGLCHECCTDDFCNDVCHPVSANTTVVG